jgi:hypothetical protein
MSEKPPIAIPMMPPVLRPESLEREALLEEFKGAREGSGAAIVMVDASGWMV